MKFWDQPQPTARTMSLGMREKPTLPALATKAVPNASIEGPSGVSMTSGPLGDTTDAP